ncbi:PAS domain S-box protein [Limisphaera sp. 4302-co]|uniref:hybrid sensor histidine kinase/response regulator n=1 Tax=Limisphaera sp. 4302-co TaxID=3400417 RepID=UPI003C24D361
MGEPLRILHLEDDTDYAAFVAAWLKEGGWEAHITAVSNLDDFRDALGEQPFDLILSDYHLPDCSGLDALALARQLRPEVPFILLSGTAGEAAAVESLRQGATDYVLKQWTDRLLPALERALHQARERRRLLQLQEEVGRQQRLLRALTENVLDLVVLLDPHGRIRYASPSAGTVLGYDPEGWIGQDWCEFVHPEDVGPLRAAFEIVQAPGTESLRLEFRMCHRDGRWRRMESLLCNRLGEPDLAGLLMTCRDITERKQAEERFRALFENSPDAIFVLDFDGLVRDANAAARQLTGCPAELLKGRPWFEFLPDADRPAARVLWRQIGADSPPPTETHWITTEGRLVPVEIRARAVDHDGEPFVLLIVRDVSDRKEAESALRESERLFFSVWENSVDGMCLTDEHGRLVAVNDAFCRLVDMDRSRLEGQPFTVIHPPGPRSALLLAQYQRDFRNRTLERRVQHRLPLHNGQVREIELSHSFIETPERPTLLLTLFRDLTAQKALEEQLRHAQKMEAIGQLAGGVAHDFNNLLTVIQGNANLLLEAHAPDSPQRQAAEQISQAAERAANLTRQLLTFSRRQVLQPRTLDLNELVHQLSRMLGRVLGEHIVLRLQFSPQPAWVHADPGMLEQVILNLVVNARDAMPEGGQLELRVAVVSHESAGAAPANLPGPGPWVRLEVVDTGCGIPPEHLKRIFEPFFTTKEVGKGTGLGLATAYGIVQQHDGWIEVESTVGRGSTFRVYLPHQSALPPALDPGTEPPPSLPAARGTRETILVVEDEPSVRDLVAALLQHFGYRVIQAANGPEALELWAAHRNEIHLLLTDLVMPRRMNGRQLAERLWQDRPDLKVIFTSGYSADVVGEDFLQRPGIVYLQKPYPPGQLARLVRQTLDESPVAA